MRHLTTHDYITHERNSCSVRKSTTNERVRASRTVDDFLVLCSRHKSIDELRRIPTTKYTVKHLGNPTQFWVWQVTYPAEGSIRISQPQLVNTTIANALMTKSNSNCTPYQDTTFLHVSTDDDTHIPHKIEKYLQVVGVLRYLADCTHPDFSYITSWLGTASHSPT